MLGNDPHQNLRRLGWLLDGAGLLIAALAAMVMHLALLAPLNREQIACHDRALELTRLQKDAIPCHRAMRKR